MGGAVAVRARGDVLVSFLLASCIVSGGGCAKRIAAGRSMNGSPLVINEAPAVFADESPIFRHRFRVVNSLSTPVHFGKVLASCSCTAATLDRDSLQPGEETELHMEANVRTRLGSQRFVCRLPRRETSDEWTYEVRTQVYRHLSFEYQDVHLGSIDINTPASAQIALDAANTPTSLLNPGVC